MSDKKEKKPKIRFPEFTDDWNAGVLGSFVCISTGKLDANAMKEDGKYDFYTSGIKKYKIDSFAFEGPAITIAGNGATVGYMHLADGKFNAYQRTYVLSDFLADRKFLFYEIGIKLPSKIRKEARTGNIPYIVMDMLTDLKINFPSSKEQIKIGNFFSNLNNLISIYHRNLDILQNTKRFFLQKLFPKKNETNPELRFPGFYDDWEQSKFSDILKVHSIKDYIAIPEKEAKYEVIQQGNEPVLGYANGIPFKDFEDITIFGDHTVSLYKPRAPFFIASDGVKILSGRNIEGNFFYILLDKYKPEPEGYKRHFSILKGKVCAFSKDKKEQKKIGMFFDAIEQLLIRDQNNLKILKNIKKGLLQQMFV